MIIRLCPEMEGVHVSSSVFQKFCLNRMILCQKPSGGKVQEKESGQGTARSGNRQFKTGSQCICDPINWLIYEMQRIALSLRR